MTTDFARKVLSGQKKLLSFNNVLFIEEVPKYKELSSKTIWNQAKIKQNIVVYFPDYPQTRVPQKKYLFNVINTLEPNTMMNYIRKLKKDREDIVIEESKIILTGEYQQFFSNFETISTNIEVRGLAGLRNKPEGETCSICFSIMNQRLPMLLFKCRQHKGHKRCIASYYKNR